METQLPALLIVLPLLAAPLCVLVRNGRLAWMISLILSVLTAAVSLAILDQSQSGELIRYAIGGWPAPTGIEYTIDRVNATLLALVSCLSVPVLAYAWPSIQKTITPGKHYLFFAAWMLALSGLLGIAITGDAFNVFVFLEISSLATYMLIAFGKDRRAYTASLRYLILGSIGASFILIGIGFLYAATGSLNMIDIAERIPEAKSQRAILVAFSFLSIGLMIKAAVFPLHAWLANAYHHAPVAATAFLAGTATKVSLYVMLRFFFSIFGTDYSFGYMLLNMVLLPAAVAGFIGMSLVAVFQTDLRRMLAFSSVAQIGYIVAGASIATQTGLTASVVHIVNHGVIKSVLFMASGCILYKLGHTRIAEFDNLLRRMPLTVIAFVLAGLGLIGIPLTAGFVSKFTLVSAAIEQGWWPIVVLILVSSLMAVVYIGRVIEIMVFRSPMTTGGAQGMDEAPWLMLLPMYLLLAVALWMGLNGDDTLALAADAATQLLAGFR